MFNKLYAELSDMRELRSIVASIELILDYTNKDGLQTGIIEAVIEILQSEVAKEKAKKIP
jgi:hypothetical protein